MKAWTEAIRLNDTYGWNVIPMYYMHRDEKGQKHVKLIDWQQYKSEPYNLAKWEEKYKALAIITGKISNLTVLDIDSEEAMNTLLNQLNKHKVTDLSNYVVKTSKGYQLFYEYEPNTKTRIGIKDKIDFLSGGITFAHSTNQGYDVIKDYRPGKMPQDLKSLILDDEFEFESESTRTFEQALRENSDLPYKNPINELLKTFIDSGKVGRNIKAELEKVFCTKEYKNYTLDDFSRQGQIHSSMLYVAGIVASNPTVDKELYIDFMHNWAKKVAKIKIDHKEQQLIENRIKAGLNYFRYDDNWKYRSTLLNDLQAAATSAGIIIWRDISDEKYVIYTPKQNRILRLSKPSFKEQLVYLHNSEDPQSQIKLADIDPSTLPYKFETFNPTVDDEFYTNEYGEDMHNNFKRSKMLSLFQVAQPQKELPDFIGNLLHHIYPIPQERSLFLHTLAYHMTYLQPSPTTYILTGKSGTGKNTLLQTILGEIYGDMYLRITAETLTGRFRNALKNKLLVFIDEVSEKSHKPSERGSIHNVIKQVVANKDITIESKGKDETTYPNHALYVMASNKDVPFKLEEGFDRRINITKTKDENIRDLSWFPNDLSTQEIDDLILSEVPEFIAYLASIELDHKLWSRTIDNEQRKGLINASVGIIDQYVMAILEQDVELLIDLDYDFGHFYEERIIRDGKSHIFISELKDQLGDLSRPISKALKTAGLIYKKVNNQRAIIVNPRGTEKSFKPEI